MGDFELIDPVDREDSLHFQVEDEAGHFGSGHGEEAKATDKDKTAAKETAAAAAAAAAAKPAAPEEAAETKQALVILEGCSSGRDETGG